jgi:nucleoid DNA-binding protein
MNKNAVALAADSAVTIGSTKTFNSANKLFMLSKHNPIGIMIYGDSELNFLSWETIIKNYRKELEKKSFNSVEEYATDFINFLNDNRLNFSEDNQKVRFERFIETFVFSIRQNIIKSIQANINPQTQLTPQDFQNSIDSTIQKIKDMFKNFKRITNFNADFEASLKKKYADILNSKLSLIQIPLTPKNSEDIVDCILDYLCMDLDEISGIVITGFGDNENYPSLISYKIKLFLNDQLIFSKDPIINVDYVKNGFILPFAQKDTILSFLEGVSKDYRAFVYSTFSKIFDEFAPTIIESLPLEDNIKKTYIKKTSKKIEEFRKIFLEEEEKIRQKYFQPLLNAVSFLPKEELAAASEALVNLVSFKRRVSEDLETVGGPIDVAIISKGDGFIWIKRKHYFKPDLNPFYFKKYFNNNEGEPENE